MWDHILEETFREGSHFWYYIQSYPWLKSPGGCQIHIRILPFFNSVQKSWNFWPSSCLYVKNFWCWMIWFLSSYGILKISGEQQLFHFITRCKGKSLICFSWLMHAIKMKLFIFSPWYPWYPWYLLHPQKKSKCFSQSFQLWLPSNEKTWGGSSQSMIYRNINNFTVY